jgi:NTP pyrophosphatase (non-canonical NTP hydrolase)
MEQEPRFAPPRPDELAGVVVTSGLSFNTLRHVNMIRLPQFKDRHGNYCHSATDGSDWSPAQWLQAAVGELGEYANVRKKYERGDLSEGEFRKAAASELADVVTYLDLLAFHIGIDLGRAVSLKFNEVSKRVGADVFVEDGGYYRVG